MDRFFETERRVSADDFERQVDENTVNSTFCPRRWGPAAPRTWSSPARRPRACTWSRTRASHTSAAVISGFENVLKSVPFHAGTSETNEGVVTNGGRVLAVTSFGKDIESALQNSYESIDELSFQGMNFRKDIGFDLIKKPKPVTKK